MNELIKSGATLGVIGGGQLGRMFTQAAKRLGYRVHVLSDKPNSPCGQVADFELVASYDNAEAFKTLAKDCAVVTYEFENIDSVALTSLLETCPVRPSPTVINTTQHRLREKTFLRDNGFPLAPFILIKTAKELDNAVAALGRPAVLKTAGFGYDGKGQFKITPETELSELSELFNGQDLILEKFIRFEKEVSVVGARSISGETVTWPVIENTHSNHILDVSFCPAAISEALSQQAREVAIGIFEKLDLVGVACVEFFVVNNRELLVNEIAPRPHNSGHLTIEASVTSQYEQQVRAICGLPLGSTELKSPAAMANLLGELWDGREPRWESLPKDDSVKLHLYGKPNPMPGKKMGHLTSIASTTEAAVGMVTKARSEL